MSKKIKIILLTSLVLNILFISFYAGNFLNKSHSRNFAKQRQELVNLLDKDHQEMAKQTLEELSVLRKQSFLEQKEILENLEKIVVAKDFDKKKFLQEMSKLHYQSNQTMTKSDEKLANLISQLSEDERGRIVKKIKKKFLSRR